MAQDLKTLLFIYWMALSPCGKSMVHRCLSLFAFSILFHWFICQSYTSITLVKCSLCVRNCIKYTQSITYKSSKGMNLRWGEKKRWILGNNFQKVADGGRKKEKGKKKTLLFLLLANDNIFTLADGASLEHCQRQQRQTPLDRLVLFPVAFTFPDLWLTDLSWDG